MIENASEHPEFRDHPGLALYGIESYVAVPLERRNGDVFGTLCALDPRPSSELEQHLEIFHLLADLIAFQLEAEELSASRERFLGVLGHDLRSPLQVITLSAHTLLELEQREPATQALRRILRGAERIEALVGDLLDFARGRFGEGLVIDRRPLDVADLLERAIDELRARHPKRELRFRNPGTRSARWDGERVVQLVVNLVENALAHSPPESMVTVGVEIVEDRARLMVHNFGKPIPPQLVTRIFQPFSQASEQATGSRSGLGLGLYIASQIAHAHGGDITVTSSAEDGTRFLVTLPL